MIVALDGGGCCGLKRVKVNCGEAAGSAESMTGAVSGEKAVLLLRLAFYKKIA